MDLNLINSITTSPSRLCAWRGSATIAMAALVLVPIWAFYPKGVAWPFRRSRREIRAAVAHQGAEPWWEAFVHPRVIHFLRIAAVAISIVVEVGLRSWVRWGE